MGSVRALTESVARHVIDEPDCAASEGLPQGDPCANLTGKTANVGGE